jgi:uncharacterized protein YjbI with pentapeptide repeats
MDAKELLLNYSDGQRKFSFVNLQGVNLEGANLSEIDFYGANLEGINLSNATLIGSNLKNSRLIKANFTNANLANTIFDDAWLLGVNFSRANLTGASLKSRLIGNADFSQANLNRANLEDCNQWINYSDFPNLDDELLELFIGLINFSGASLKEANLKRSCFDNSDFSKADLSFANLREAELRLAKFKGACLNEADFIGADLKECDFSKASLINSNFTGANLSKANLSEIVASIALYAIDNGIEMGYCFSSAHFIRANLYQAKLTKADLWGTNFTGANLTKCDLNEADMTDADLSECNISGASFEKAQTDNYGYPCKLYRAYFYEDDEPIGINLENIESIKLSLKNFPYPHKLELINGRKQSRKILIKALDEAKERLIMVNPWLTEHAIDNEILQKVKTLIKLGCQIYIGWGHLNDTGTNKLKPINRKSLISKTNKKGEYWKYKMLPELEKLEEEYPNQFQLKLLGTHAKYLICDHSFGMMGSHNFLTSGDNSDEGEAGIMFDDPKTIVALIQDFDDAPNLDSIE